MYEVNGNFPADDFFRINTTTGQICVNKDLKLDTNAREQYEVCTPHMSKTEQDLPLTAESDVEKLPKQPKEIWHILLRTLKSNLSNWPK